MEEQHFYQVRGWSRIFSEQVLRRLLVTRLLILCQLVPLITLKTNFWKISPGAKAHLWPFCQSGSYIALGWHRLGNVTDITLAEFEARCRLIVGTDPHYTPDSVKQLWTFANDIKVGDHIVANQGKSKVLGVGVVTGHCEFHPENPHYKHQIPVDWYDTKPRVVQQGNWSSTLLQLKRANFEAILDAPKFEDRVCWKFVPNSSESDWEKSLKESCVALGYDGLGDIAGLHYQEFEKARDTLRQQNPSLKESDINAVWGLTQLLPANLIVAVNRETRRVQGYGEVTGTYFFAQDAPQCKHRLPVRWHSVTEIHEDKTKRLNVLRMINETEFELLTGRKTDDFLSLTKEPLKFSPLMPSFPLNQILYGPPGTGKTFDSLARAVEIIDGTTPVNLEVCKARFDELYASGHIKFVTFHQSFSYEEFVEGLRPILKGESEGIVGYEVRDGVFKEMALQAISECLEPSPTTFDDFLFAFERYLEEEKRKIFDTTFGDTYELGFNEKYGIFGGKVILGTRGDYIEIKKEAIETIWNYFRKKPEDFEPEADFDVPLNHKNLTRIIARHFRLIDQRVQEALWKYLSDDLPAAVDIFLKSEVFRLKSAPMNRFVLIVDEINRGNISKIMGELITLLEEDKRMGNPNALSVTLPVSQERFALPSNLYILGTMNTADKSLALIDTALRRRFYFTEMPPRVELFPELARDVLQTLNLRLEAVLDREHRLGHAYFIGCQSEDTFNHIFSKKIIPLLQEFFYNDWESLREVLGESGHGEFIKAMPALKGIRSRTKWRWWFDAENATDAAANFNCLAALKANYARLNGTSSDDQ